MTRRPRSPLWMLALSLPLGAIIVACNYSRMPSSAVSFTSAPPPIGDAPAEGWNTESYQRRYDNPFLAARDNPVSTFGVDVDTASYANVRRFIEGGACRLRTPCAWRNWSTTSATSSPSRPASTRWPAAEVGPCPWRPEHRLVRIGLKARTLSAEAVPPRNLVFLIDVSGSMDEPDKLPLVKRSARSAGRAAAASATASRWWSTPAAPGLVLPPTLGRDKPRIREAIERLEAGGSTNGGGGHRAGLPAARRELRRRRHQPRDPRHRRRLQRRRDQRGRAGAADRGQAPKRASS